ncbi:VOC family protein [Bradyrhizobium sp. dw_78]|uniref:VOC family protein n=1 Tax=Bradyrhizobium sp. dw_78 TaxID=2719793 RepID=UPI001BD27F0D
MAQVCITRATRCLSKILAFYRDAVGLPVLFEFDSGSGTCGAMLGLPGTPYHLEFIQSPDGEDCTPPSRQNVLVLHIPDRDQVQKLASRLQALGHAPVAPANPFWIGKATVFEDPDGWPLVLNHGAGLTL